MGRKRTWTYCDTSRGSYGTMRCTACHKLVKEGQFRVRETEEAYLVQHRHCSEQDENWAKMDAGVVENLVKMKERLAAYLAFREKWEASDLDESIEWMQEWVTRHEAAFALAENLRSAHELKLEQRQRAKGQEHVQVL
jgi:NAD-dependent SIR2 family protein deacetylase